MSKDDLASLRRRLRETVDKAVLDAMLYGLLGGALLLKHPGPLEGELFDADRHAAKTPAEIDEAIRRRFGQSS